MVVNYIMDIDDFLTKSDFILCLNYHLIWPWPITHFTIASKCYGCGNILSDSEKQDMSPHFTSTMNTEEITMLVGSTFFWCKYCGYAAYDHFTQDECEYCYEESDQ